MTNQKLNILLLDDNPDDAFLIVKQLQKSFEFDYVHVTNRDCFITQVEKGGWDLILSDHNLIDFDSNEAFEIVKSSKYTVPFIMVTGSLSEEFAVDCIKKGMDNYILKDNLIRLEQAIISALAFHKSQRQKLEAEVSLINQNEDLKKINKELDSIVYRLSHDLRAPLLSIMGLLNLINALDVEVDNEVAELLYKVNRTAGQMDDTIRDMLDYSRNSRVQIQPALIDIKELISKITENLSYLRPTSTYTITIDYKGQKCFNSDEFRLKVVISNLISNAIKYLEPNTTNGEIRIFVDCQQDILNFTISDNGVGIRKDCVDDIFKMFYRANEVYAPGSGLGLYILKEALDKINGEISITSEEKVGTTAKVTIPAYSL